MYPVPLTQQMGILYSDKEIQVTLQVSFKKNLEVTLNSLRQQFKLWKLPKIKKTIVSSLE